MDTNKLFVIKVGSRLVADNFQGVLPFIAKQIEQLIGSGYKVVLISSGAVALGRQRINNGRSQSWLYSPKSQPLLAAVGQGEVIARWNQLLKTNVGQVLVDREDFCDRHHFLKTSQIIFQMLSHNVIPIINENDTLSYGQLCLGNNDFLAAQVASMLGAKWLVLLTDRPYIYKDYPVCREPIFRCSANDATLKKYCKGSTSTIGTGGMSSKVAAAQLAARKGVNTLIGGGSVAVLDAIEPCSKLATQLFAEPTSQARGLQLWLSEVSESKGHVYIDPGAERAIVSNNASLLLPGIVKFEGVFDVKNVVSIRSMLTKQGVAKGIIRMSSNKLNEWLIMRQKGGKFVNRASIVVHRNELAVLHKLSTGSYFE